MFELKRFVALMGVDNRLMQLFFDKAEKAGLQPRFDIYHILAGDEKPSDAEIKIMEAIYDFNVRGTYYEDQYKTSIEDFHKKIADKNRKSTYTSKDTRHFNN